MASGDRKTNPRKTAKAGGVSGEVPVPPKATVTRMLRKSETLSFRLTPEEKDGLRSAASSLSMSISEYVVKCHEAVAKQLGR